MTMPSTVRTPAPAAVYAGSPRIAAARAYLARMMAARDSIDLALDCAIDAGPDYASERAADWYSHRLVSLEHDIARLQRAIRRECARTGEAIL